MTEISAMAYCCVPFCRSSKGRNTPGISFHEFPSEPRTRLKWLEAVSCRNSQPQGASSASVVCCLHFKPSDFKNSGCHRYLRRGAVPSVFPGKHPFPEQIMATEILRIKKTHGPDFVENLDSPTMDTTGSYDGDDEPLCFICGLSGAANSSGETEALLICRDCSAKAHPSCLNYTPEVAAAARLSSWQCVDCKMCMFCGGNNDSEEVLVCDACDKGYHMNCHRPKVAQKPLGKWLCKQCCEITDRKTPPKPKLGTDVDPAAGLPTPCDSPVPEEELKASEAARNVELSMYFSALDRYPDFVPDAKDWSVTEVEKFLVHVGFPEQANAFKDQEIDGRSLLLMKRSDVLMGLSLKLGPALKIYNHIKRLQTGLSNGHLY